MIFQASVASRHELEGFWMKKDMDGEGHTEGSLVGTNVRVGRGRRDSLNDGQFCNQS
jgi:hypothetical protein